MVLWEPVLYQAVGGPEVMRKQLAHLLELSRQERVRIQVLPFTAGAHTGTKGAFTMFRSPGEPDVCYTENHETGKANVNSSAVRDGWVRYAHFQASALSVEGSVALINRVMEEHNAPHE